MLERETKLTADAASLQGLHLGHVSQTLTPNPRLTADAAPTSSVYI